MDGDASVSSDVVARYAADAVRGVDGVRRLVPSPLHRHRGIRISGEDGRVAVELHLELDWGASVFDVGRAVQARVALYLEQMTGARPHAVNVVVDEIASPS